MDKLDILLRNMPEPQPPANLTASVMRHIKKQNKAPEKRFPFVQCGAACLAASVLAFVLLGTPLSGLLSGFTRDVGNGYAQFMNTAVETIQEQNLFNYYPTDKEDLQNGK